MNPEALKAAVIITAAGASRRMGTGGKKEFLKILFNSTKLAQFKNNL